VYDESDKEGRGAGSRRRQVLVVACVACVITYASLETSVDTEALRPAPSEADERPPQTTAAVARRNTGRELLRVYKLPPTFPAEPSHLTPVDPASLLPQGTHTIDAVHRHGHLHTGHILYVTDANGWLLFLRRSDKVVTCPATWSLLGEHSNVDESSLETVVRGLGEGESGAGHRRCGRRVEDAS